MWGDTWVSAVATVGFVVIELAILNPIFEPLSHALCKVTVEEDENLHNLKAKKMKLCFCKLCFFVFSVVWGYKIMLHKEYFPKGLGGSGDFSITLTHAWYPYPKRENDDPIRFYILVTSGYHISRFFIHLIESKGNDFLEMALHHTCALYLYGGLYLLNIWEGGTVIAVLHDWADIFVNILKILGDSNFSAMTGVAYFVMLFTWIWTRLILLPKYMLFPT